MAIDLRCPANSQTRQIVQDGPGYNHCALYLNGNWFACECFDTVVWAASTRPAKYPSVGLPVTVIWLELRADDLRSSGCHQRDGELCHILLQWNPKRFGILVSPYTNYPGNQWRRKQFASGGHSAAPAEIFFMCPLTFLLCPPHEGAQRLFVTDWETIIIEVVKSGEGQ